MSDGEERKTAEKILRFYKNIDTEIALKTAEIEKIDKGFKLLPREIRQDRARIELEADELCRLRGAIRHEIDRLSTYEKIIIIKFYIEGKSWVHISGQIHYSCSRCKDIRTAALRKLAAALEVNPITIQLWEELAAASRF